MSKRTNFYLHTPNQKTSLIYLSCYVADGRVRYCTGERIDIKYWNETNSRVDKREVNASGINSILDNFENIIRDLSNLSKVHKTPLVRVQITEALDEARGVFVFKQVDKKISFWEYFQNFIDNPRLYKGLPIKKNSIKSYTCTFKRLKKYEKASKTKIEFSFFDKISFEKFQVWMYKENYSPSTVQVTIKKIKTILSNASEENYDVPVSYKKVTAPEFVSTKIALSNDELLQLSAFDFSQNKRLEKVRDLFLIGCFTALRFSDYSTIQPENIFTENIMGNEVYTLRMMMTKTGNPIKIPLAEVIVEILEKYDNVLPIALSNQKMNLYIKEVCKTANLNRVIIESSYRGGVRQDEKKEVWEMVSTHTARRTGATELYKMTRNVELCMKLTGHKDEKSFRRYIKLTEEDNYNEMYNAMLRTGFGKKIRPNESPLKVVSKVA